MALLLMTLVGGVQPPLAGGQTQPVVGQEGKDVPWVPTPDELVDTMLDMGQVSADDLLVDLGSGDGRLVVAAARLGARAIGIEIEPNLVARSIERAAEAGVSDLTEFVTADLFEYDLSQATVITLFLLPDLNLRLRPILYGLKPGTRIVSNTWHLNGWDDEPESADGWTPDETVVLTPCPTWCTAMLWIVPAKMQGTWSWPDGELRLSQRFERLSGTLRTAVGTVPIADGQVRGNAIAFRVGVIDYTGTVSDDRISGVTRTPRGSVDWNATRSQ